MSIHWSFMLLSPISLFMSLLTRAARRIAFLVPLILLAGAPAPAKPAAAQRAAGAAQAAAAAAQGAAKPARAHPAQSAPARSTPWLYRGSDVPQDKAWTFGELGNGLRYAVRHNTVPPGQVSIRIRIDAGSLYERPGESGFAHLIEHLTFRQSKYLGEAQAIPTWQRLGASFGTDTNAETSPTQTVFRLDLPDASPVGLEESFRLLSGMISAPTLSESNIRNEVPIVLAEKRERGGAAEEVQNAYRTTFYKGQPLADHAVIGTVETLEGAHQEAVRAFHTRWYRPENAVIVVSGDVDPLRMELLVRKYFTDWNGVGKPIPAPSFGDPKAPAGSNPANPVGETKVLVEADLPRQVSYTILRPWRQVTDNIAYNQGLMIDSLSQAIINRRLEARARSGGSFLKAQVGQEDVSRSADTTSVEVSPLGEDWQKALRDARAVIADAMTTPPTQDEIDREAAEMEIAFKVSVEQRELRPGAKIADDLVSAVDIRETVAAPDAVLAIFKSSVPLFTPNAVLTHTRQLFRGTVIRAIALTPKAGEIDGAALRQAMIAPVIADGSARLSSKPISFAELPAIGARQKPVAINDIGLLSINQTEFANGVKVLTWPSQDEPGRVTVKVRFGAGYRAFGPGDAPYITLGKLALISSGQGSLGEEELDRISTGRRMGFDFDISDSSFEFSSETRPQDLADQLYLFAAKFAQPRWDANPIERAKAASRLQYEAYAISPQGILERDLDYLQRNRDPRFHTPTPAEIAAVTPQGFRQVWQPILASGPIEVQIYGDFDSKATAAALEKTFGALPARLPLPASTAPATGQFPAGTAQPEVITHHGAANQAAAVISWPTGGGMAGVHEARQLDLLTELFTNRLLDAMREKLGASYAPQVYSVWPRDLDSGGSISAIAQLQPEAVPIFFKTAQSIAADLAARPASADELARVTEPMRQKYSRASATALVMWQLEGATGDPSRIAAVRSLMSDYTETTPAKMQALAQRYFAAKQSWQLAVLPQGKALAEVITR